MEQLSTNRATTGSEEQPGKQVLLVNLVEHTCFSLSSRQLDSVITAGAGSARRAWLQAAKKCRSIMTHEMQAIPE
jgi:hypothetical protein